MAFDLQGGQDTVERRAGHGADADMPHATRGDLGQITGGVVQFQPDTLGAQGQGTANGGQPDATAGAFMDNRTNDTLDLGHQTRGCGLRDADAGGSLRQLLGVGQGGHQAQMAEFQAFAQQVIRPSVRQHINFAMFSLPIII